MLITKLKDKEEIISFFDMRPFIFRCSGCEEVYSAEEEIDKLIEDNKDRISGLVRLDYLCREEFSKVYVEKYSSEIERAGCVIVFSCGVGVQVIAKLCEKKRVLAGCDTCYLNGFQGLSTQNFDCQQCGECYLNYTGGICPLTACSKGLLNGPCGGAKNGKCEVSPEMDCGWELIYKRLRKIGKEEMLRKNKVLVRDYRRTIPGNSE
jgi:electron transport complex protein RnfC